MSDTSLFQSFDIPSNASLPELALSKLNDAGAITMVGDDKKAYLQGQVTCNVAQLSEDTSMLGAHCDAKGKVWSVFRLFHHRDGYAMFQPQSAIEAELRELKKYAVFSKVTISESDDVPFGIVGAQAEQFIDSLGDIRGDVRHYEFGSAIKISANRWLLLVDETYADTLSSSFNGACFNETLWNYCDIQDAFPALSAAQQCEHIPQALNLQALDGVSFSKGCYTGQETVARAKYRGINKRQLAKLTGSIEEVISDWSSEIIERSVGDNWRAVGSPLLGFSYTDNQATALLVIPNNLEEETTFRLQSQPNTTWQLQTLPYSLDEE